MSNLRSEWDNKLPPLESLGRKFQLLRDRVTAVVRGLQTGLYVYGEGGIGKSHTVTDQLEQLGATFQVFNSRMNGKGLFRALKEAPDSILVAEDIERLTNDRDAQGVLRAALCAVQGRDRRVTWTTGVESEHFLFRGGIVLLANRPLANFPELRALDITDCRLSVGGYRI